MEELTLEEAYALRAAAHAFIDPFIANGECVEHEAVVTELRLMRPGLSPAAAVHLAERVFAMYAQCGPALDYYEAPPHPRAKGLRQWYPVRRDDGLQRVPLEELTASERGFIGTECCSSPPGDAF